MRSRCQNMRGGCAGWTEGPDICSPSGPRASDPELPADIFGVSSRPQATQPLRLGVWFGAGSQCSIRTGGREGFSARGLPVSSDDSIGRRNRGTDEAEQGAGADQRWLRIFRGEFIRPGVAGHDGIALEFLQPGGWDRPTPTFGHQAHQEVQVVSSGNPLLAQEGQEPLQGFLGCLLRMEASAAQVSRREQAVGCTEILLCVLQPHPSRKRGVVRFRRHRGAPPCDQPPRSRSPAPSGLSPNSGECRPAG